MKPITIKELYEECEKQIKKGNENKIVMLSSDDEANDYHYCWFLFSEIDDLALDTRFVEEKNWEVDNMLFLG